MRLTVGSDPAEREQTILFANWLLNIGEGKVGGRNDGEAIIDIPEHLLITQLIDPIGSLIDFVYTSFLQHLQDLNYFQERAILAPKNEVVHEINDRLLALFPGEEKEYLSADRLCESEFLHDRFDQDLYSLDVLNGLKLSGLPNHKLILKVGVPVMLLRNIDQNNGQCNGTRLQVMAMGHRVIEAKVITGSNTGSNIRLPLAVCFAMTINKSQDQSLSRVGFTHGQLYVSLSRVKSRQGLKILILDNDGNITNKTSNVVYKEVFRCLC